MKGEKWYVLLACEVPGMRLNTEAHELENVCRRLEERTNGVRSLDGLVLPVRLVDSLDPFTTVPKKRTSPAAYYPPHGAIYVNRSGGFLLRSGSAQEAVLMHEVAHAHGDLIAHDDAATDDYEADYRVCEWGFVEELAAERGRDDPEYGKLLASVGARPEEDVKAAIQRHRFRKNSGLL